MTGSAVASSSRPRARGRLRLRHEARAALVAVRLGVGEDLVPHQGVEARRGAEDLREGIALLFELLPLAADPHLLETRQVPQP